MFLQFGMQLGTQLMVGRKRGSLFWLAPPYRNARGFTARLVAMRNDIEKNGGVAPSVLCVICGLLNAACVRPGGAFVVPITALKN